MTTHSQETEINSMFSQGLEAHNSGNLAIAEKMYQEILSVKPDHPEANHNFGILLVAKNECSKALEFFKFALNASPNVSLFWASYIDALIKLERIIEAKALIKAANNSGMSSNNIKAISDRLDIENQEPLAKDTQELDGLITEQKFVDAIDACTNLLITYPNSAILNIGLGKCYCELGEIDIAISCYTKATEYWPQSEVGFEMLAQIHSSRGDTVLAIENLKRAVEINRSRHELNLLLGEELINNGDAEQAISYLQASLVSDPHSSIALTTLGTAFRMCGDYDRAIASLKQAIKLNPQDILSHFNMGVALTENGSLDGAIVSFKKALSIKPDYAAAYFCMGNAQKEKGDLEEAIESFKQAIKISPDYSGAYNNMGNALRQNGDLEGAIESFKQALKMQPHDYVAYNNMGIVLDAMGNSDAAMDNYTRAIKIKPKYADAHHNMGGVLSGMGRTEAAIEAYKNALSIRPDYADTYHAIGGVFVKIGDTEAAIEAYKQALNIEPDHVSSQHLLAALTGQKSVSAPNKYIESLFDNYSSKFEESLIQDLGYRMPKAIAELIWKLKSGAQFSSMLDLGCGTGLVGVELRDICQNIEGIDLSRLMLRQASQKNAYDKLNHTGIVEYLSKATLDFDLFIAADVFVYVGDLAEVFRLIKLHNKCKGWLVFSTEHTEKDGFSLEASGRYSHSKSYIESLCAEFKYNLQHFSKVKLRKEGGELLSGGLYALKF